MTKLISDKMQSQLNEQIINEFHAEHTYIQMACKFTEMGLRILAKWFNHHAEEERSHGLKILNFILDVGGHVTLGAIPKPKGKYDSIEDIVQSALDHELLVTRQINDLVTLAYDEKDYATRSFLQWFVDEQVEEVNVIGELMQLVKLAGGKNMLQVEARVAKMMEAEN